MGRQGCVKAPIPLVFMNYRKAKEIETEADRFASAFLMPRTSVLAHVRRGTATVAALAAVKATWGVSVKALARRLRDLSARTRPSRL